MLTFDPKTPLETVTLGINFKRLLASGETIYQCSSKIIDSTGQDVSSDMLVGSPDITSQPLVRNTVKGGMDGETYILEITVQTSNSQTFIGQAKLPVSDGY